MNRGVAKRVIFEDRADYRRFVFLLVCATRRGQLEVIAYSLMPNHFHLLVRSNGSLSEAMRRIQNDYSRWFNRRHRRDGPLIRGRFKSRPVLSIAYFGALLAYIDHNPVSAGICAEPSAYPWGSARFYATGEAPRWLAVRHVFDHLADLCGAKEEMRTCYVRLFGSRNAAVVEFAEAELHSRRQLDHQLDHLLRARPARVHRWMLAKLPTQTATDPGPSSRRPVLYSDPLLTVLVAAPFESGRRADPPIHGRSWKPPGASYSPANRSRRLRWRLAFPKAQ